MNSAGLVSLRSATWLLLLSSGALFAQEPHAPGSVVVELARDSPELTGDAVSGRLLVFLASDRPTREGAPLRPTNDPEAVWIAATTVDELGPGESVRVNVDSLAFPKPLSEFPRGPRYLMALIDVGEDFGYYGFREGDVLSEVTPVDRIGTPSDPTRLLITRRVPPEEIRDSTGIQSVSIPSQLLSSFHAKPVTLDATVVLPPDGPASDGYRVVYHVPGWGGDHLSGYFRGRREMEEMRQGGERHALHVYLDPTFIHGHHAFADSDVNGPWGEALVSELVPFIEERYGVLPRPENRLLLGHSSGGWSVLWLQISHPGFFGGAWATAPDPVDFRSFFAGVSVLPGSNDNAYGDPGRWSVTLTRPGEEEGAPLREVVRREDVLSPGSGQIGSFEAVFGARADDGGAVPLFDHVTGEQNSRAQAAWRRYDIRYRIENEWSTLAPALRGKLHVFVGAEDEFFLDLSTAGLCEALSRLDCSARCHIVNGRGHFDLYRPSREGEEGLLARFGREMEATARGEPRPSIVPAFGSPP